MKNKIKHENITILKDCFDKNRNEINKINTENSKNKYYSRLFRELNKIVINSESIRADTDENGG